ncbi:MAG: EamA family transporter [Treponema sp.]|nr:EamA family transporter [Candidatus Treponema equifaecale]
MLFAFSGILSKQIEFPAIIIAFGRSFFSSLKYLSAQIAGIISSLETIYGILLAIPLCGEFPSIKEIAGGILILGAVFYSEASSMNRVKHR